MHCTAPSIHASSPFRTVLESTVKKANKHSSPCAGAASWRERLVRLRAANKVQRGVGQPCENLGAIQRIEGATTVEAQRLDPVAARNVAHTRTTARFGMISRSYGYYTCAKCWITARNSTPSKRCSCG